MDQPGLGILIADLRKKQGLTQEELVERCNLNVRTIQRIEAGEVNPRSYTVKNILEALGTSIDDVFKEEKSEGSAQDSISTSQKTATDFMLASGAISGIIYLFIKTISQIFSISSVFGEDNDMPILLFAILSISEFVFLAWFYLNLYRIGLARYSKLFAYSSLIFIVVIALLKLLELIVYPYDTEEHFWYRIPLAISIMFIYGLCYVFLGIGLFTERHRSRDMVKWAGIFGIIGGFGFITLILFPVGMIGTLVFEILLIALLFSHSNVKKPLN